ncbi:MAG: phosphoribosylaminoimidazolesuccinocarboxamide synthase [Candidatus Eiseniibacteriota bacterium]|nr:MAG: phosphoribosylaminoimidazolesuccinocarboxamide synthase [Candidatus Eisenbacteria bacterium]
MSASLTEISLGKLRPTCSGKVRDVYDVGHDRLIIVATDRISAFDSVLPSGIPEKGIILTKLSAFWFQRLGHIVRNHFISCDTSQFPPVFAAYAPVVRDRAMLVRKAKRIDFECVARGYLAGSAWQEYSEKGTVCEEPLESGLVEAARLARPIFSPATKAASGHDENVSYGRLERAVGAELAGELRRVSLELYSFAAAHCEQRGLILADTKFEFGLLEGQLILIDEVLSPDSSRFWPADSYEPGRPQESFDKQFVRNYLKSIGWKGEPPAPPLPPEVVQKTRERYLEALERICGEPRP